MPCQAELLVKRIRKETSVRHDSVRNECIYHIEMQFRTPISGKAGKWSPFSLEQTTFVNIVARYIFHMKDLCIITIQNTMVIVIIQNIKGNTAQDYTNGIKVALDILYNKVHQMICIIMHRDHSLY